MRSPSRAGAQGSGVRRPSTAASALSLVGDRCIVTKTAAGNVDGSAPRTLLTAATPPAEDPITTMSREVAAMARARDRTLLADALRAPVGLPFGGGNARATVAAVVARNRPQPGVARPAQVIEPELLDPVPDLIAVHPEQHAG